MRAPLLSGVLGYRRGAEGGAPLPRSPRTPSQTMGQRGRHGAGRFGAGDPGHPAAAAPSPRGQGAGAVLGRLGLSPRLGSCGSGSISLPFPAPWPPLHMVCGGSALPGPPWAGYLEGAGCASAPPRLPAPSPQPEGKEGAGGIGSCPRVGPRKAGVYAGSPGPVGAGSGRQTVLLLHSVGCELRAEVGLSLRSAPPNPAHSWEKAN